MENQRCKDVIPNCSFCADPFKLFSIGFHPLESQADRQHKLAHRADEARQKRVEREVPHKQHKPKLDDAQENQKQAESVYEKEFGLFGEGVEVSFECQVDRVAEVLSEPRARFFFLHFFLKLGFDHGWRCG